MIDGKDPKPTTILSVVLKVSEMDGRCHICGYIFDVDNRVYNYQKYTTHKSTPLLIEDELICDDCDTEIRRLIRKLKREKENEKNGGEQKALDRMESGIHRGETSYGDD